MQGRNGYVQYHVKLTHGIALRLLIPSPISVQLRSAYAAAFYCYWLYLAQVASLAAILSGHTHGRMSEFGELGANYSTCTWIKRRSPHRGLQIFCIHAFMAKLVNI